MSEAECSTEVVESDVHLLKRGVDGVVVVYWLLPAGMRSECGKRAEQAESELDEEHADLGTGRGDAVAPSAAQALHQAFGAQLGQVIAELAEAIVVVGEPMTGQDASV